LGSTLFTDFTKASSDWTLADGTTLSYTDAGANFVINKATDAPTISSAKYIFFGNVQVWTKAAPGVGIVSSFILESDDLDEIDWEWLGSTDTSVESNFFGKGNTTTYDRAIYHPVASPIEVYHNYTIDWTSSRVNWYIDNALVRTLNYGDALALGGKNYPQTPMRIKMGNWVGCASVEAETDPKTEGTCQWAAGSSGQGGAVNFANAPFIMYVQNVTITDYGCGSEYTYGDETGDWQSIKTNGNCVLGGGSGAPGGSTGTSSTISAPVPSSTFSVPASTAPAPSASTPSTPTPSTTSTPSASPTKTSESATLSGSAPKTSATGSATGSASGTTSSASVIATPTATGADAGGLGGLGGGTLISNTTSFSTATTVPSITTNPKTSSTGSAGTSASVAPANAGNSLSPRHKYGMADFAVVALGLGLGYLVM
jgi:hypothetical protein